MRKLVLVISFITLIVSFVNPVPSFARTSPRTNFPWPVLFQASVFYDVLAGGENVSVHIYSKCFDSNPGSGPWYLEFVVQYDNEDASAYAIETNITGVPQGGSTAEQIGVITSGTLGSNQLELLHLLPGNAISYTGINVNVTVNGTTENVPIANAGCGPTSVTLTSTSTSAATQGWLLAAVPLAALVFVTAVFLRRRVQVQA